MFFIGLINGRGLTMVVNIRSELFFLKQFGFSAKLLESIFLLEYSPINAIFDTWSPEHFHVDSDFTEKDRMLSSSYPDYLKFKKDLFQNEPFLQANGVNKIYFKYDKNLITELLPEKIMPIFMYCKGNIELLNNTRKRVAIVGTRNPSKVAIKNAELITKKFIKDKHIIVSGLAEGIDTVVHETALNFYGDTIAVLPTGFNSIYPKKNVKLANDIAERGLLVSAIGPNENTYKSTFLERNQYVAGISDIVFVIETSERSGTMNTIRNARNLGKKILYMKQLDDSVNDIIENMGGELFGI